MGAVVATRGARFLRLPTVRFTLGSDLPWGSYGRYLGLIAKLEHVIAVRLAFHNKSASIVYSTTSGVRRRSVYEISCRFWYGYDYLTSNFPNNGE